MFLKKDDIFNFNVDEIEVYGTFKNYKELLKGINSSNSDCITFEGFTLKKSENLRDYEYKVDFWKDNFPCFAFYIGKEINSYITTRDYFKAYGSAFQIIELPRIIDFIDKYVLLDSNDKKKGKSFKTLKRFDLAMDIKKDIKNDIVPNFSKLNQKGTKYFGNSGVIESYYIGEYKKRLNRDLLIRTYNKVLDIKVKNKQALYSGYLKEDSITRIEIEFRDNLLKFTEIHELLDTGYLFNLFIMYIEKHTKLFKKIKMKDIEKLKRLNKKINLSELKTNQVLRNRYINTFLGYARKIKEIGLCPIDILIRGQFMGDHTKANLVLGIETNIFSETSYIEKSAQEPCKDPYERACEKDLLRD